MSDAAATVSATALAAPEINTTAATTASVPRVTTQPPVVGAAAPTAAAATRNTSNNTNSSPPASKTTKVSAPALAAAAPTKLAAPAETRLNANAKSFTPGAAPIVMPPPHFNALPPTTPPPAAMAAAPGVAPAPVKGAPPSQRQPHPVPQPRQQQQQQHAPANTSGHKSAPPAPFGKSMAGPGFYPPQHQQPQPMPMQQIPMQQIPMQHMPPQQQQHGKYPMMMPAPGEPLMPHGMPASMASYPAPMQPGMMAYPAGPYMMPQQPFIQPPPQGMMYAPGAAPAPRSGSAAPPQQQQQQHANPMMTVWMPPAGAQQQQQQHPPHPPQQLQQPPMQPYPGAYPMYAGMPGIMPMPMPGTMAPPQPQPPQQQINAAGNTANPPTPPVGKKAPPSTPPQPQQQQQRPMMPGMHSGPRPQMGMMPYFPAPPNGMMPGQMGMMPPPGMMPPMMAAPPPPPGMQQQQQMMMMMPASNAGRGTPMANAASSRAMMSGNASAMPPPPPPPPTAAQFAAATPMAGCAATPVQYAKGSASPNASAAASAAAASSMAATSPAASAAASAAAARVSVGNASLAALNSKEPPKFSCVLLSGIPAVGKTTLGRELVNSLKTDGMGWAFFSGADFLPEQHGKRSVWETTKEVFDALSKRLDELLEQQRTQRNIKGLVIDKNCKGIEDIYYLNALLRSKQIPFVGIVGMECADDKVLVARMGGDAYLTEKLKFHRVIHARIVSLSKSAGMYRSVDATKSKEEVVQQLRTMVLGCCAQPPTRGIMGHQYEDSRANVMVDDYSEYSNALTHLFQWVNSRNGAFPGTTDLVPFSVKEMTDKNRISALKARYGIRRKVDGNRYLLLYHAKKLYLIPPHMRAVLQMPLKAWLGTRLDSEKVAGLVLEGDLARLSHDRQKEMFLVYDAHFWSEAEAPSSNTMIRMTFAERQSFLAAHLCNEDKAFFGTDSECAVVHQPTQKMTSAVDMLDSDVYPSDGLIFQAVNPIHRSDHTFAWQQPSCLTVDFRVGKLLATRQPPDSDGDGATAMRDANEMRRSLSNAVTSPSMAAVAAAAGARRGSMDAFNEHPMHTFALEVYDKSEKKYVQYESATVDVRHPDVVEGCIVTCSLVDDIPRRWMVRRLRYDVLRPIYKSDLEELLDGCLIPRAKLVSWLLNEQLVPSEIQPEASATTTAAAGAAAAGSSSNTPSMPPPPSYDAAAAAATAMAISATSMSSMPAGISSTMLPMAPPVLPPPPPPPMMSMAPASATATPGKAVSMTQTSRPGSALPPSPPPLMAAGVLPPNMTMYSSAGAAPPPPPPPAGEGGAQARMHYTPASALLSRGAGNAPVKTAPSTTGTATPGAAVSTETQMKQLASIVPSFHVVASSKSVVTAPSAAAAAARPASTPAEGTNPVTSDGKVPVAARVAAAAAAAGNGEGHVAAAAASASGTRVCAQCHRAKQNEDLRVDRRDRKYYCYSCWSKDGHGFCVVCGEFKEVRREVKGRNRGSSVCGPCSAAAAATSKSPQPSTATSAALNANSNSNSCASAPPGDETGSSSSPPSKGPANPPSPADEAKAEADAAKKARKKAAAKEKKAAAATPPGTEGEKADASPSAEAAAIAAVAAANAAESAVAAATSAVTTSALATAVAAEVAADGTSSTTSPNAADAAKKAKKKAAAKEKKKAAAAVAASGTGEASGEQTEKSSLMDCSAATPSANAPTSGEGVLAPAPVSSAEAAVEDSANTNNDEKVNASPSATTATATTSTTTAAAPAAAALAENVNEVGTSNNASVSNNANANASNSATTGVGCAAAKDPVKEEVPAEERRGSACRQQ